MHIDYRDNRFRHGIRRIAAIGILTAMGLVFHFIESLLPLLTPVPGARLGLANIPVGLAIVLLGVRGGGQVLILRIFLGSLLAGTFLTFPFYLSLAGGVLAFSFMAFTYTYGGAYFSLIGVSIMGAVAHNLGQILVAVFFIGGWGVMYYLPFLSLIAIPTGFLVGAVASYTLSHLQEVSP